MTVRKYKKAIDSSTPPRRVHRGKDRENDRFDVKQDYLKLKSPTPTSCSWCRSPTPNRSACATSSMTKRSKRSSRPSQEGGPHADNWSRRFKNHSEKLRSGTSTRSLKWCGTCRSVTRTRVFRPARSACSPGSSDPRLRADFALNVDTEAAEEKLASSFRSHVGRGRDRRAGQGQRYGGAKQFAVLNHDTVTTHSVRAARSVAERVVLVVPRTIKVTARRRRGRVGGATRAPPCALARRVR